MFLKIATILAIVGLLMTLMLSLAHQLFVQTFLGRYYGPGIQLIYKLMSLGEMVSFTIPLVIFFVAFFLIINNKQS